MRHSVKPADRIDFVTHIQQAIGPQELKMDQHDALARLDDALNEALLDSFPASDPISSLQLA